MTLTRRELFPALGAIRIVHEDEHLLAVAKPAGVSCQSADPKRPDDLPHRLKEHLRDRGEGDYLGIHQRLDQATSGLVLYTRTKEANPGLARQMEGRTVRKRYLAAVRGDVSAFEGEGATLSDWLGRDGPVSVVLPEKTRKAKRAISHVRVLEKRGDRALLELRIETGRTHQIRAQLAYRGLPVAGDRAYGEVRAPRLMLHAAMLGLTHPVSGDALELSVPTPASFGRWLEGEDAVPVDSLEALRVALVRARESRWGLGRAALAPDPTTAFRLLNRGGDGVPGLAVDVYGEHLLAHLYGDRAVAAEETIVAALAELGFAGVYVKKHPKQKNTLTPEQRAALAPTGPVWGAPAPEELAVHEHGVAYSTALGDGLSTGLFLDQRDARLRLREAARGRRVLNLFCYAGAFGVAAAVGEAAKVVQVDVSRPALERAARSEALNGVRTERIRQDVFAYLGGAAKRGERFDIVVVDPPSYSTTGKSRWTSGADWVGLAEACFRVCTKRGTLVVSSNDGRLTQAALRRHVHEGARKAGVGITQMKDLPEPPDFPGAQLHRLWIRLGEPKAAPKKRRGGRGGRRRRR